MIPSHLGWSSDGLRNQGKEKTGFCLSRRHLESVLARARLLLDLTSARMAPTSANQATTCMQRTARKTNAFEP